MLHNIKSCHNCFCVKSTTFFAVVAAAAAAGCFAAATAATTAFRFPLLLWILWWQRFQAHFQPFLQHAKCLRHCSHLISQ